MPQQFTFKTTKETDWLDKVLLGMGRLQRSEYIRDAIIQRYMRESHQSDHSDKPVTQSPPTSTGPKPFHVTPTKYGNIEYYSDPPQTGPFTLEEPEIISKPVAVEDLDKKLTNMDDNFS